MKIQQGVVRYKDRSDLVCNYGITDDGKQYYFLDDKPLSNGNIIASTTLVEAVDPTVKATHAGVITRDGNIVIPLENKMVKNLGNNILLVERAVPATETVLETIKLKNVPEAATKLVTTPATIKDRLMLKMENEGRFVFNDQFSEASIFDYDGKNLIDDEYFSFIGMNSKKIYFSKNTVDSEIVEYSIFPEKVATNSNANENIKVEEVAKDNKEKIENAINGQIAAKEGALNSQKAVPSVPADIAAAKHVAPGPIPAAVNPSAVTLEVKPAPVKATPIAPEVKPAPVEAAPIAPEVKTAPVEAAPIAPEVKPAPVEAAPIAPEVKPDSTDVENKDDIFKAVNDIFAENNVLSDENKNSSINVVNPEDVAKAVGEVIDNSTEEVIPKDTKDVEKISNDAINLLDDDLKLPFADEEKQDEEKKFSDQEYLTDEIDQNISDKDLFGDSILNLDKIDLDYADDDNNADISSNMNIIDDITKSMSNLISLNKKQSDRIIDYEKAINRLRRNTNDFVKRNKSLEDEIRYLNGKIRNYETIVSKLEKRNQELDDRIKDQATVIKNQEREISSLKPSATSKEELLKLIQDANSLIDDDERFNYRKSS